MKALVIGKFLPPHAGHHALIGFAATQAKRVEVAVCAKAGDLIPARLRIAWLREAHPDAEIVEMSSDDIPDDSSEEWAHAVRSRLGPPDVVAASEAYGPAFARHLGARNAEFDPERRRHPVRAGEIMRDPSGHWDHLGPAARGFFCLRIGLVGAESTGKTTLGSALADALKTEWVEEFGREYTEILYRKFGSMEAIRWTSRDFAIIAREQQRREDEAARRANRVLICDTDSLATAIWHRRYMGRRSPATEKIAGVTRIRQYLLTDAATPFFQDGLRDGEAIRQWMHAEFRSELCRRRRPFAELSGSPDRRHQIALDHIRHLQAQPFDFARAVAGWPD